MSILSYDEEFERAADRVPFSNSFEGDVWMANWCEQCRQEANENMCPLLDIASLGRTPVQWTETNSGGLADRYECSDRVGRW